MPDTPRIGLIGAGAVGSLLAASLLHNGVPFQWVVRNAARRKQLDFLVAEHDAGPHRFAVPEESLLSSIEELTSVDWLILVVKAQQVASLLAKLPPGVPALVVANGLHAGPFDLGVLYGGVRLDSNGVALFADANTLWAGPLGIDLPADTIAAAPLTELMGMLASPWLEMQYSADIRERMWHKLALNCIVNPLTALLDCPNGNLTDFTSAPLVQGVLREVAAVAEHELGPNTGRLNQTLENDLVELLRVTAQNSSSMREDLCQRRETEIRALNLAVADLGERLGVPCPLIRALGSAVWSIEEANRRA